MLGLNRCTPVSSKPRPSPISVSRSKGRLAVSSSVTIEYPWRVRADAVDSKSGAHSDENEEKTLKEYIKDGFASINVRLDQQGKQLGQQGKQLGQQGKQLGQQSQQLGRLNETHARTAAADMLGSDYTRPLLARSPQDVMLQFSDEVIAPRVSDDPLLSRLALAEKLIDTILKKDVPNRLLRSILGASKSCGLVPELVPCYSADGSLDTAALGAYIANMKDPAIKGALQRLQRLLDPKILARPSGQAVAQGETLPDEVVRELQHEALLRCDGAGVMCSMAAAFPERYLLTAEKQEAKLLELKQQLGDKATDASVYCGAVVNMFLPTNELQFDMRGRSDVVRGKYAYIDIGETKSSADYAAAVVQLGLRLGVLRWVVKVCFELQDVRLVGRMFVPGAANASAFRAADAGQQAEASERWCYSLYVHYV